MNQTRSDRITIFTLLAVLVACIVALITVLGYAWNIAREPFNALFNSTSFDFFDNREVSYLVVVEEDEAGVLGESTANTTMAQNPNYFILDNDYSYIVTPNSRFGDLQNNSNVPFILNYLQIEDTNLSDSSTLVGKINIPSINTTDNITTGNAASSLRNGYLKWTGDFNSLTLFCDTTGSINKSLIKSCGKISTLRQNDYITVTDAANLIKYKFRIEAVTLSKKSDSLNLQTDLNTIKIFTLVNLENEILVLEVFGELEIDN